MGACEHGAYGLSLTAALGGAVAAERFGLASLAALAAVVLAVPARAELLGFFVGQRPEGTRWIASWACAAALAGVIGLSPPAIRGLLMLGAGLGVLLVIAHMAATLRLGARDGRIEVAGGFLAALAGPMLLLVGGKASPSAVAALLFLLAIHAAVRVVLTRRALAAHRLPGRHAAGMSRRERLVLESGAAALLAALTGGGAVLGLLPAAAPLLGLPGLFVATLAAAPRSARGVGVREVIVSTVASIAAGLAVRPGTFGL